MQKVSIEDFSKDHWSLFGYVESKIHSKQVAPGVGKLDPYQMRINEHEHKSNAVDFRGVDVMKWNPEHGTRLVGYFKKEGLPNAERKLPDHDDIHCLEDFEHNGLLEIVSVANLHVKFTEKGHEVANELRTWKNKGNHFFNFVPSYIKK